VSLEEFAAEHYKIANLEQLRRFIRNEHKNGASMWVRRVGRRIFVDVDKFFEWTKRKQ